MKNTTEIFVLMLSLLGLRAIAAPVTAQSFEEPLAHLKDKKISISVSQVDIKNVIQAFSKQTGINVVIAEGIDGKISLNLRNVGALEALSSILSTKGYSWYAQDEQTIVTTPHKISHTFTLKYAHAKNTVESLSKILGEGGALAHHQPTNSIVVHGSTDQILKIQNMLLRLDVLPKQVLVETKIIELNVGNRSNLGVIASYTGGPNISTQGLADGTTPTGISTDAASKGVGVLMTYTNTGLNLTTALNMLEKQEGFNLIASPRVIATNNMEAQIHVGEKLGYKVTSSSAGGVQESVAFLDVGTRLLFTPRISEDGYVTLVIHPEKSSGTVVAGVPQTKTTEANTEVTVQDGQTLVIGGLIEESQRNLSQGIPFLKNIPVIGIPFRGKHDDVNKKELIVFMTPQILTEELQNKMVEHAKEKEKQIKTEASQPLKTFL